MSTSCFFIATTTVNLISLCYLSQTIGQVFANFKNLMVLISFVAIFVVVLLLLYLLFSAFGVVHLFNEAIANKQSETVVRLVMSMYKIFIYKHFIELFLWLYDRLYIKSKIKYNVTKNNRNAKVSVIFGFILRI